MKTKNFLMLVAVMTAMAITSVMMTSCTEEIAGTGD